MHDFLLLLWKLVTDVIVNAFVFAFLFALLFATIFYVFKIAYKIFSFIKEILYEIYYFKIKVKYQPSTLTFLAYTLPFTLLSLIYFYIEIDEVMSYEIHTDIGAPFYKTYINYDASERDEFKLTLNGYEVYNEDEGWKKFEATLVSTKSILDKEPVFYYVKKNCDCTPYLDFIGKCEFKYLWKFRILNWYKYIHIYDGSNYYNFYYCNN